MSTDLEEFLDHIDASVFSGTVLENDVQRDLLRLHCERWLRAINSHSNTLENNRMEESAYDSNTLENNRMEESAYDSIRAALTVLVAQARDEERQESNLLRVEVERLTKIAAWNQDNVNALLGTTRNEEAEACAEVCDAHGAKFYPESPFSVEIHTLANSIRARIAARKGV